MLDIVLVSNGPGEVCTWVRPVLAALRRELTARGALDAVGIHLVLTPCPNANGTEARTAAHFVGIGQIVPARHFCRLLCRPRRYRRWRRRGVVVFLGGDQMWAVLLAARLGYRQICYAEWVARWPRWCDRVAAMGQRAYGRLPQRWRSRARIVGDLMADTEERDLQLPTDRPAGRPRGNGSGETLALLPGSKPAKLSLGLPFLLATAQRLRECRPRLRFLLPLAPTLERQELLRYALADNPFMAAFGARPVALQPPQPGCPHWQLGSSDGLAIILLEEYPATARLRQCRLALTTIGANTAELGAIGLPMMVLLPTQHLQVMRAWDGCLGLLGRLPLVGRWVALAMSRWALARMRFFSWPNIEAGRAIVPERIGPIHPHAIAAEVLELLQHPATLEAMAEELRALRGGSGAAGRLARLVLEVADADRHLQRRGPLQRI